MSGPQQRTLPQWLARPGERPTGARGYERGGYRGRGRGRGRGNMHNATACTPRKIELSICPDGFAAAKFPYDPQIVEFMRTIRTAHFDRENTQWKFSADMYDQVVSGLLKSGHQVEEPPEEELKELNLKRHGGAAGAAAGVSHHAEQKPILTESKPIKGDNSVWVQRLQETVPSHLFSRLKKYQIEGIAQALAWNGRVLIADEMGLGKTVQALTIARYYMDDWPLLIVCPSSLRLTWAAELNKWLGITRDEINIIYTGKTELQARVSIISYDLVSKFSPEDLAHFTFIIADESHYMKSHEAKRTKAMVPLIQHAKHALLLSGTPALSRPIELFSQLNALERNRWRNPVSFGTRYCAGRQTPFGWDFSGSSNLDELHEILSSTCMIRRLKKDVLGELPAKRRQIVHVSCDKKLMKEMDKLLGRCAELDNAMKKSSGDELQQLQNAKRTVLMELYTLTGKGKLPAALEYIEDLLAHKDLKFLVFAHHREVMNGIAKKLDHDKVAYIRIDGDTKQQDRQPLCDRFQSDPNCRVGVLSITAAGLGLTLHAATLVMFAELAWTPSHLLQGEDRAHRVGQVECVDIKYLLCEKTLDDFQWPLILRKMAVVGQSIDGQGCSMDATDESAMDELHFDPKSKEQGELEDLDAIGFDEGSCEPAMHTAARSPSPPLPAMDIIGARAAKRPQSALTAGSTDSPSSQDVGPRAHKARRIVESSDEEPAEARAEPAEANVLAARHGADDGGREEVRECPVCGQQRPWYSIDAHVDKCLDGVLSD